MGTLILINCFLIQSVTAAAIDNEEEVMGLDTESEMSDDEDPDYCPTGNPTLPTELDQSDTEESSYESSEEESEVQITFNRMSCKGSYWSEFPPTQGRIPSHNILSGHPGPAPVLTTTVSPKDAWELFITQYHTRGDEVHKLGRTKSSNS